MDVETAFSGTKVINFNNGETDEEAQREIVRTTTKKLLGTTGVKAIFSFNQSEENKTTVDDIPLDNAPEHYAYLAKEAQNKILAGHNVTSHMLVGISEDGKGFSSNADEIVIASEYFYSTTINHKQEGVLDALDAIIASDGLFLDLRFKKKEMFKPKEQEPVKMSSHDEYLSNELIGNSAELGEEWVLIDSRVVDYDDEDRLDAELTDWNTPKLSPFAKLKKIINTGTARPNAKSEQDGKLFKVRYRYTGEIHANSREFCRKMIDANKIYRKEDIIQMNNKIVNQGWGAEGADKYDIWFYKGGGACGHVWVRETYALKSDVNNPNSQTYTAAQARKAGEILPTNDKEVYMKPRDMKNNGFLKPRG